MLDAVVFDAGGTLIRLDFEWMSAEVSALGFPLDAATLRRGEVQGRRRFDATRRTPLSSWTAGDGSVGDDTRAYFGGMLEACGVPSAVSERALTLFHGRQRGPGLWTRAVEGARDAIDGLRAAGVRMACVSNSDGRAEWHLRECGVRDGLEFVVDSHLEQVEKPDPRIFHIALERLGVPAERALYVGDILSVDQAGASGAGMRFVLIDPYGDYAPRDVFSISAIAELPSWIRSRFAPAGAAAAPTHAIGPSRETAGEDSP
jgi:HAD superfamily hydrolase (TIGR01509 family)